MRIGLPLSMVPSARGWRRCIGFLYRRYLLYRERIGALILHGFNVLAFHMPLHNIRYPGGRVYRYRLTRFFYFVKGS